MPIGITAPIPGVARCAPAAGDTFELLVVQLVALLLRECEYLLGRLAAFELSLCLACQNLICLFFAMTFPPIAIDPILGVSIP